MATRLRILILLGLIATTLFIWGLVRRMNAGPVPGPTTADNLSSPSTTGSLASPAATQQDQQLSPSPSPESTLTASSSSSPSPSLSTSSTSSPQPAEPARADSPATPPERGANARTANLIIPVAGVRPEQLQDTFTAARSEGHTHDAIDIIAPKGTPVLAAADGPIIKLFLSKPGGITIYQLGTDNKTVYYYAHLERYADGLAEGHFARQGEPIAYVGDTGNAGAGNYHLHFSVSLVADPKRYWQGVNINPYPLLKR